MSLCESVLYVTRNICCQQLNLYIPDQNMRRKSELIFVLIVGIGNYWRKNGDNKITRKLNDFLSVDWRTFIRLRIPDLALAVSQMTKREDLHLLRPRQFEYLTFCYIKDILDCNLVMTKETRDGGYDLICFDSVIGPFIVEAKKYNKKKVDVSIIRQLVGVQARDGIPKSILVTTGQVTADAIRERDKFKWTPYSLEIHDIDDITSWLNKKANEQIKIDMKSILARIGFISDKDLVYDPDKKSLLFCET
jgi:Restriction endonuclease